MPLRSLHCILEGVHLLCFTACGARAAREVLRRLSETLARPLRRCALHALPAPPHCSCCPTLQPEGHPMSRDGMPLHWAALPRHTPADAGRRQSCGTPSPQHGSNADPTDRAPAHLRRTPSRATGAAAMAGDTIRATKHYTPRKRLRGRSTLRFYCCVTTTERHPPKHATATAPRSAGRFSGASVADTHQLLSCVRSPR